MLADVTLADRRCLARLWLFLAAVYVLTMAGRLTSGDGEAMYQTTKALVTEQRLSIEPRAEAATGRDGRAYSKYGLGQSLAQAPFFVVGHGLGKLFGAADDRPARFAVGMTNSVVTATLAGVFWLLLRELRLGRGPATALALVFGLATLAWPYARADFAEPLQALALLLAFYGLVRWRRRPALGWAFVAGAASGLALLTKAASVVLLPPLGLYFAGAIWQFVRGPRGRGATGIEAARMCAAAAIPLAIAGLVQVALNLYRFGSVAEFGYGREPATGFTTPVLTGISYLLASPGKGLFLFAPPALLGVVLLPLLARQFPLEAAAAALVFAAELLYFGRWWAWHGDWCWGPRYLVVVVPFVMLGWVPLAAGWGRLPLLLRALGATLAGAGLVVSLLGVAIDYGAYYSVLAHQVGRGVDVREARLVPAFSPLLGHAWLVKASLFDAAAGGDRGKRDRSDNPFLPDYPWAASHPELAPGAPERALGFDFWFAAVPDRPPFIEYWSALLTCWLALALLPLSRGLWLAARAGRAPEVIGQRPAAPPAAARPVAHSAARQEGQEARRQAGQSALAWPAWRVRRAWQAWQR